MTWASVVAFCLARGIRLQRKEDSRLMRVIAVLVWIVNRNFMDGYYTIIRDTLYIPASDWGQDFHRDEDGKIRGIDRDTLMHEAQHARDSKRFPVLFELSYLFANAGIVAWPLLWWWVGPWWALPGILGGLVGPGMRAWFEWRGYRINVRDMTKRGNPLPVIQNYVVPQFVYQHYAWMGGLPMWPFRNFWNWMVRREFNRAKIKTPPQPIEF